MALLICVELGSMVPGNKLVERMARMGSPVEGMMRDSTRVDVRSKSEYINLKVLSSLLANLCLTLNYQ